MEEKVETKSNQKDEVIEQEVEAKAKLNNSLDEKTAVVNENNKIVDIDTVLAKTENQRIKTKVDNLTKLGFGLEYIKKLIAIKGNFSVGSSEQELVDEIDKITKMVIQTISDNTNGIKLNEDGSKDEIASEEQQKIINAGSDVYSQSYMLSKASADEIFDTVLARLNNREEISYIDINEIPDWFISAIKNNNLNDEEISNAVEIYNETENILNIVYKNLTPDEISQAAKVRDKGFFEKIDNSKCARAVLRLNSEINLKIGNSEKALKRFEETLQKYFPGKDPQKVLEEELGFSKEYNIKNLQEFAEEVKDAKDQVSTIINLERNVITVTSLEKIDENFVTNIAMAFCHKDNPEINALVQYYEEKLGRNLSSEKAVKELLLEHHEKEVDDIEEYLYSINEFCTDTNYEHKMDKVDDSILRGITSKSLLRGENAANESQRRTVFKQLIANSLTKNEDRSLQENYIKELIYKRTDNFSTENKAENCKFVLHLYQKIISDKDLKTDINLKNGIEEFVKENIEIFSEFIPRSIFKDLEDDTEKELEKSQEEREKEASEKKPKKYEINRGILKNVIRKDSNFDKDVLEDALSEIVESQKECQNARNMNKRLFGIFDKDEISEKDEKVILKYFADPNIKVIKYLSREEIAKVKGLENSKLTEILERKLVQEREDSIQEQQLDEVVFLIEAKKRLFINEPEYEEIYDKSQESYKKSRRLEERTQELTDENIDSKIDKYIKNIYEESLKELIKSRASDPKELIPEAKNNYASLLLLGLESDNPSFQAFVVRQLKTVYEDLENIEDVDQIRKKTYERVYGLTNESDINKKAKEKQELFTKQIILEKEIEIPSKFLDDLEEAKIADSQYEKMLLGTEVELNIDLSKGVIQNLYQDSKIFFSEGDEKLYQELYKTSLSRSWLHDSEDAKLMKLLSLISINETMEDNKNNDTYNGVVGLNKTQAMIEEILEEKPELKNLVFDENGNVKEDFRSGGEDFKKESLQATLLGNIKNALTDEKMTPKKRLKYALLTYSFVHPPKEYVDDSINKLFDKLGNRLFEMLSTEERPLIQFDKNNHATILTDNVTELYHELNYKERYLDSFEEICEFEQARNNTLGAYAFTNKYEHLKPEDYDVLSKIESVEERKIKLDQLHKDRYVEDKIKETPERRFKLLEDQISVLTEDQVRRLNNKAIAAVWYNCQIKKEEEKWNGDGKKAQFKSRYSSDLDEVITELKGKFVIEELSKVGEKLDIGIIENALKEVNGEEKSKTRGKGIFENILKENIGRKENRKKHIVDGLTADIRHLSKSDIDENQNETLNCFWYNSKTQILYKLRMFEEAKELEQEFKNKFNGKSLKEASIDLDKSINKIVDKNFFGVKSLGIEEMKVSVLGEKGYAFAGSLKKVDQNIKRDQKAVAKDEIENIIKSGMAYDEKVTRLANMYKIFSCDKENKEESQIAMQMIKNKMQFNKDEFEELINSDRSLDIDKLLTYTDTKKYGMSKTCNSIINKMHDVEKRNQTQKAKVRKIYDYFYSEDDSKKDPKAIQELIEDALEEKLITPGIQKFFEANNPELYKAARENIAQLDKTSWIDMAKRGLQLSKNAILNLPKLLKEDGRKEFSNKFSTHFKSGTRKFGMKSRRSFKELNSQVKSKRSSPKMQKALFGKKQEALPPGVEPKDKVESISVKPDDKAQNNQTEKIDYINGQQFKGSDNGVYQKMLEAQKNQENQPEQENSGGLKKSIIVDDQEIE